MQLQAPRRDSRGRALSRSCALLGLALAGCVPRPDPPAALAVDPVIGESSPPQLPVREAPSTTDLRVLIGGDLVPHRPMLLPVERLSAGLAQLGPLLAGADIAIANYETATGDPARFGRRGEMALGAPGAWLAEVGARFGALTVANNHACDLGRGGLTATLDAARRAHVVAIGADAQGDPWKARVVDEKDGRRVCAVAWTTFVNSARGACRDSRELAIAGFDRDGRLAIERGVKRARGECDVVVAIFHGGEEYSRPIWGVRDQARIAADSGADAVVVHHPHVPALPVVVVASDGRRVPVFESVGNLLANQGGSWGASDPPVSPRRLVAKNAWTRLGVLADLRWSWPPGAPPHAAPSLTYGYHLTWTDNDHVQHRLDPMPRVSTRVLDPLADRPLIDRLSVGGAGPVRLFKDPCWFELSGARCVARDADPGDTIGS